MTPEYLGVGYIIGPHIAGVLASGGVLSWLALIPLLAFCRGERSPQIGVGDLPPWDFSGRGWIAGHTNRGANDLPRVRPLHRRRRGGRGGRHDPRQDHADDRLGVQGIVKSFGAGAEAARRRTDRDLPDRRLVGSLVLALVITILPFLPGPRDRRKLVLGLLIVVFGFFFVTVATGSSASSERPPTPSRG